MTTPFMCGESQANVLVFQLGVLEVSNIGTATVQLAVQARVVLTHVNVC